MDKLEYISPVTFLYSLGPDLLRTETCVTDMKTQ